MGFGIIQTAMGISPHVPVYRPDGSYGNEIPAPEGSAGFQSPVKIANEYKNPSSQFRLLGNTYAEFAISGSLKFRTTFGADLNYAKNQIWDTIDTEHLGVGRYRVGYGYQVREYQLAQ